MVIFKIHNELICVYFYLFSMYHPAPKVEVLEKQQYLALVEKGYAVIDVRTADEYEEGHIEGAKILMSNQRLL